MSIATLIRRMSDAGASPEVIAIAVEAIEEADARVAEQRAAARDRKRKQRLKEREAVTVTGQSRDSHNDPSLSLPLSPQTPLSPTHTHPDITTRARGIEKSRSGTRLPDDWQPDFEAALAVGLGRDAATRQAEMFLDYWRAVPGAKGRKADWLATWRNWCRRAADDQSRNKPNVQRTDSKLSAREANYARSLAGFEMAVRAGNEQP